MTKKMLLDIEKKYVDIIAAKDEEIKDLFDTAQQFEKLFYKTKRELKHVSKR